MVAIRPTRVVGYARISSEGQMDNTSINEQIKRIKAFCTSQGFQLVKVFTEQETGSSIEKRLVYQEMIEFITNPENQVNGLVVLKADRVHRKLKNLLVMIEDILEPNNIAFVSVENQFDTSTAHGMLTLQMLGSFAEFERKQINERTRSGRLATAKSGEYAGGEPPYGYKAGVNGLEIDQTQAVTVRRIFNEYSKGNSLSWIAQMLNQGNVPTKTEGKEWTKQSISYILKNPIYAGVIQYDGDTEKNRIVVKEAKHEPIVSKNLFGRVQGQLKARRKK